MVFQFQRNKPFDLFQRTIKPLSMSQFSIKQSKHHLRISCCRIIFSFPGTWCGDRNSPLGAGGVGGSDRALLQQVGQNPDAASLPAGLQAGAAQSAGDGGMCGRRRRRQHVPASQRRARVSSGKKKEIFTSETRMCGVDC